MAFCNIISTSLNCLPFKFITFMNLRSSAAWESSSVDYKNVKISKTNITVTKKSCKMGRQFDDLCSKQSFVFQNVDGLNICFLQKVSFYQLQKDSVLCLLAAKYVEKNFLLELLKQTNYLKQERCDWKRNSDVKCLLWICEFFVCLVNMTL